LPVSIGGVVIIVESLVLPAGSMDEFRGKTVRRVALDFSWPLGEPWQGYINPWPGPIPCATCAGLGYNSATLELYETFDSWGCRATKKEVEALLRCDFTQKEVARLLAGKVKGDSSPIMRFALVEIRARRKNLWGGCEVCSGKGEVPNPHPSVVALYEGVNLYEQWRAVDPPVGDGWQFWDNDGVPLSPVFDGAVKLAEWCRDAFVEVSDVSLEHLTRWILSVPEIVPKAEESKRPFRLHSDRFAIFVESDSTDEMH
jgi:hypothetical protein